MQHFANKIENSLSQLAKLLGIPIKLGWKTELSKWIGIKRVLLATWIYRNDIPKKRLTEITNKGYPPEMWMIHEDEKKTPANNLTYTPLPVNNEEYELIQALRELDPISRKGVYLSAVEQCNEAMRERNIRKDKRKKEILKKTIKTLTKAVADI